MSHKKKKLDDWEGEAEAIAAEQQQYVVAPGEKLDALFAELIKRGVDKCRRVQGWMNKMNELLTDTDEGTDVKEVKRVTTDSMKDFCDLATCEKDWPCAQADGNAQRQRGSKSSVQDNRSFSKVVQSFLG